MKLRLILKTSTKNNKDVKLKLNIPPSKVLGFIKFVNLALKQNRDVKISFEKVAQSDTTEVIRVGGQFKFQEKLTK